MNESAAARLNAALEGRYRIESELGEGGMATVYLADDLKHERKVALKVLKPELAAVVGAERFLAEIKTTANLQHPHILPLFDSGEADSFLFYVMPYVEGETLGDRLARDKQLPVDEAVQIASDVADALQAAHEHGVIHRDIKPANILLSRGRPLVADFGIALAVSAAGAGRLTETGLSMGTPFYMSPEQASADRDPSPASDVYSLGCVLFEMLIGEPPFTGGSAQAVLAKILTGEVPSPAESRPLVTPNIDAAIRKSLEKLPADRFASAAAFSQALSNVGFRHGVGHGVEAPAVAAQPSRAWTPLTAAFGALALVMGVALWVTNSGDESREASTVHFILQATGDSAVYDGAGVPGVSLDGRSIAHSVREAGRIGIQVRDLGSFEGHWIEGTDDGFSPFFSPNGEWLGFLTLDEIRKVPIGGGEPTTVAVLPFMQSSVGAWTDDDQIILSHDNYLGLLSVSADGGTLDTLTTLDAEAGELRHALPIPLPGGRVLFQVWHDTNDFDLQWGSDRRAAMVSTATRDVQHLQVDGSVLGYLDSGHLIVWRGGQFLSYPFDVSSGRVGTDAEPLRSDLRSGNRCFHFQLVPTGTVACVDVGRGPGEDHSLAWFDRSGEREALPFAPGPYRWPRVSPDGMSVAVSRERGGDLSVFDLTTRNEGTLRGEGEPVWTPDGATIVYWDFEGTSSGLYAEATDGSGERWRLTYSALEWATSISPDGQTVLFYDEKDLWTIPLAGGEVTQLTTTEDAWERDGAFSPNGRHIAYSSYENDEWTVYVAPYPELAPRTRVSDDAGGIGPQWSEDGSEIFYIQGSKMMVADVLYDPTIHIGARTELFDGGFWVDPSGDQFYSVAPDGRFLMVRGEDPVELRVVTGLRGGL